jgi:uncharacterized membrane protein
MRRARAQRAASYWRWPRPRCTVLAMTPRTLFYLTLGAALGCGLVAGVFFAFSNFVMPALARLPPAHGIAAMQKINVTVLNRTFLGVFMGTAAVCLALAIASLFSGWDAASKLRAAGCVAYVVGTFAVTAVFNVPLNEALERVAPESAAAAELWSRYLREWTTWNSVRGLAALAAAALLTLALVKSAGGD